MPVKDPQRGEEVKIYIVLKPGFTPETATPDLILGHAAKTLAAFKVPRYLEYVPDLPRTPSQKIKKDVLKELRNIRQDILILQGSEDKWRPMEETNLLLAALPNSRLTLIRNAGHLLHEEKPERLIEAVLEHIPVMAE